MLRVIVSKEIKEMWRENLLKYSGFILLFMLVLATIIGVEQYHRTNRQYQAAKNSERSIWETQSAKNPHSAAHYGTYAFKPKVAFSLIDKGVNQYTGNVIFLEAHKRNEAMYSEASDSTEIGRFGDLSISFVLLYLFPLLILLLCYKSFSKEKEMDTLRLLKSQNVSSISLVIGKWLAAYIPIFISVSILFLLIGGILSSVKDYAFFDWTSLAFLFGGYLLYYIILLSLFIAVSIWSKTSSMSFVICLFIWILFSFVVPKISTNITNDRFPYPTKQMFQAAVKDEVAKGLDGHNPWNEEAKLLKEKTLKEYGVDSVSQLPFNYDGYRMQKGEEYQAKIYKKHYEGLKDIFFEQSKQFKALSSFSPLIPLRLLSMNICNTGYIAHWNFSDKAESYRIQKQRILNNDLKDNSKTGDWDYKMTQEGFKKLPHFQYEPPTLNEILKNDRSNFFILFAWVALSLFFLFFSAKKI